LLIFYGSLTLATPENRFFSAMSCCALKHTMPRIITGTAKGTVLKVPHKARPITDRAKTTLFDLLGPDILDKRVLDLYAGSGSFGIEALSRGAKSATFIDNNRYAAQDIKDNLGKAKLSENAKVIKMSSFDFVDSVEADTFDIVFADPPFPFFKEGTRRVLGLLNHILPIIPLGGAVILKHPSRIELTDLDELTLADKKDFGESSVSIWVRTV